MLLFVGAAITDYFDGYLARLWKQESRFGAMLDPIADKAMVVIALQRNDPVLYFIQRMRDEAHRFAIGTHRAKRSKAIGATPLDDVPGVGASRKRALLQHFGSAKAVSRADLADLKAVEGVSDNLAETIYDFFHERG